MAGNQKELNPYLYPGRNCTAGSPAHVNESLIHYRTPCFALVHSSSFPPLFPQLFYFLSAHCSRVNSLVRWKFSFSMKKPIQTQEQAGRDWSSGPRWTPHHASLPLFWQHECRDRADGQVPPQPAHVPGTLPAPKSAWQSTLWLWEQPWQLWTRREKSLLGVAQVPPACACLYQKVTATKYHSLFFLSKLPACCFFSKHESICAFPSYGHAATSASFWKKTFVCLLLTGSGNC